MERELEKTECLCKCEEISIVSSRDNLLLCSFRIALGEDDANFCKPTKTLWKEKFFLWLKAQATSAKLQKVCLCQKSII